MTRGLRVFGTDRGGGGGGDEVRVGEERRLQKFVGSRGEEGGGVHCRSPLGMGHHLATAHLTMTTTTKMKWIQSDEFCSKTLACSRLLQGEGTNLDAVVGEQQLDAARVAVRQAASIADDL